MAGFCSVCTHTQREEVDSALVRGKPYRHLSKRYGLALGSLSRHKREHLQAEIARAEAERIGDIHERFRALEAQARRLLHKAEQAGDYSAAIAALRETARLIALAEPPPPPPDPSAHRVSLEFSLVGPETRVAALPPAEEITDAEVVPEPAKPPEPPKPPPAPKKREPPRYQAHDPHDPFWSDPTQRDAREDMEAKLGGDPTKGF